MHRPSSSASVATAASLRAPFDATPGGTVGVEQELMVLDARTLDLTPRAGELHAALGGEPWCRTELPAAQIEVVSPPCARAGDAVRALAAGHAALLDACGDRLALASSGTHPFASAHGDVSEGGRYAALDDEYGWACRRAVVFGLHVHVAVGGAERTRRVFNALRSHLPALAALATNAPFHDGADTGLASVRPKLSESFPRQGVPPVVESFEWYADLVAWGARGGAVPDPSYHWWEARLHPVHGTLEVRCPDAPGTLADVAALTAVVQALVARLAERVDAGEELPVHDGVRIAENRWRALRHGIGGTLLDLDTGVPVPTRHVLTRLLADIGPTASRLGIEAELVGAYRLLRFSGADRQRVVAAERGLRGLVEWMVARFARDVRATVPVRA